MTKPFGLSTLLLVTTLLVAPAALAQTGGGSGGQSTPAPAPPATTNVEPTVGTDAPQEEDVEVSTPGAEAPQTEGIVVTGRNIPNVVRATPQVLSVLSAADIARTGEGDIAGALTRVTGLSVVGNGFVFVRGLGDRYSSSLLNGSPLPSPEPLRRTVPLDIFPTTIVASALVQKSYSVNYPGEFGGGVINLTTRAVPRESFLQFGASASFDTVTTGELAYVYDGGDLDWLGYDDGERERPSFIGQPLPGSAAQNAQLVSQLSNAKTSLLQTNYHAPVNASGEISLGHVIDAGDNRFGVIASGSVSNGFRTRDATQQDTTDPTGALRTDQRTVLTDNRIVVNGLLGLGAELGDQSFRLTSVYIHDTLKQGRLSAATVYPNSQGDPRLQQNTNWFERQLIDVQGVGELKFGDLSLDLRGSYANSKRNAPYERFFSYRYDAPTGYYVNSLQQLGESATIAFSELDENLWSGQADLAYRLPSERPFTLSAGYYYSDTDRVSDRFDYDFINAGNSGRIPFPFSAYRPDVLLSDALVNSQCSVITTTPTGTCITLRSINTGGVNTYNASLRIHAGYVQAEAEASDALRATIGVRYEDAEERVLTDDPTRPGTLLNNDYWLPAATLTFNPAQNIQLRLHASKTIARPQFRELAPQLFRDFESDRLFQGNERLIDSELYNLEARAEWYFAPQQRVSVAGFYKRIDDPVEQVSFFPNNEASLQTGFSNAPTAKLYGAELELVKYFPLDTVFGSEFFATRRLLLAANYTYTQSSIDAGSQTVTNPQTGAPVPASLIFRDGARLTGQSDHIANVQFGIEDTETTSQLTVLLNYASDRVTNRGSNLLPDIIEEPGLRLDVVARQGFEVAGAQMEVKFEARNLTGEDYEEFQDFSGDRVYYNRYKLGRLFTIGLGVTL